MMPYGTRSQGDASSLQLSAGVLSYDHQPARSNYDQLTRSLSSLQPQTNYVRPYDTSCNVGDDNLVRYPYETTHRSSHGASDLQTLSPWQRTQRSAYPNQLSAPPSYLPESGLPLAGSQGLRQPLLGEPLNGLASDRSYSSSSTSDRYVSDHNPSDPYTYTADAYSGSNYLHPSSFSAGSGSALQASSYRPRSGTEGPADDYAQVGYAKAYENSSLAAPQSHRGDWSLQSSGVADAGRQSLGYDRSEGRYLPYYQQRSVAYDDEQPVKVPREQQLGSADWQYGRGLSQSAATPCLADQGMGPPRSLAAPKMQQPHLSPGAHGGHSFSHPQPRYQRPTWPGGPSASVTHSPATPRWFHSSGLRPPSAYGTPRIAGPTQPSQRSNLIRTGYEQEKQVKAKPSSALTLHCEVCKVSLNAVAQAKQHYEGKMHAKKLRLQSQPATAATTSSTTVATASVASISTTTTSTVTKDVSSVSGSVPPPVQPCEGENNVPTKSVAVESASGDTIADVTVKTEPTEGDTESQSKEGDSKMELAEGGVKVEPSATTSSVVNDPTIYCGLCKVSFNSGRQAELHYNGKKHRGNLGEVVPKWRKKKPNPANATSTDGSNSAGLAASNGAATANAGQQSAVATDVVKTASAPESTVPVSASSTERQKTPSMNSATPAQKRPAPTLTYSCNTCNMQLTSEDQLKQHLQGAKHAARLQGARFVPGIASRQAAQYGGPRMYSAPPLMQSSQWGYCSDGYFAEDDARLQPIMKRRRRDFSMQRLPSGKYYCQCCNATCDSELTFGIHVDSTRHQMVYANKNGL